MDGLVLGMAMLIASTGGLPAQGTPRGMQAAPAITFDLAHAASTQGDLRQPLLTGQLRSIERRGAVRFAQATPRKRFSKTDRVIAIAAGVSLGWIMGGAIGFYAASDRDNPNDDTSGLKGVVIGAPVGAAIGAIIGHRLTR